MMRVWYKQDDEFLLPRGILTFYFDGLLSNINPENFNYCIMFVHLVQNSMSDYSYSAKLSGLEWELINNKNGITLYIEGYDHKQLVLLEKIIDKMINFQIDKTMFEKLKKMFIKELKNMSEESNFEAHSYLEILLNENMWNKDDLLKACDKLTIKNLRKFVSQVFKKSHIECLIYGNFTKIEALKIASIVELNFKKISKLKKGKNLSLLNLDRVVNLDPGLHLVYEIMDKMNVTIGTLIYYPREGQSMIELNSLLELFAQIIAEPIVQILRNNNKQLSYIRQTKSITLNKSDRLTIYMQSDKYLQYNELKVDEYLESIKTHINNVTLEEFAKHKESLIINKISKKPKSMVEMSAAFWNEIFSKTYSFDRTNMEIECLKNITKEQILQFYEDYTQ
ncbi:insulin-degrading enzyme-like [Leptopilina boulardi]|uniref:insulin-degrading enzyme-like n=1 Tax=Leptopilina boulardi TaxID=63433 RepID=UPI0021F50596|nr:insulin-degrading enzyme-like [Leptopilina boulardi]